MYSKEDRERILADLPKHSRYPEATRREALSLLRKGLGPAAASRRLGVSSDSVVASWSRKTAGGVLAWPPGRGRLGRPPLHICAQFELNGLWRTRIDKPILRLVKIPELTSGLTSGCTSVLFDSVFFCRSPLLFQVEQALHVGFLHGRAS